MERREAIRHLRPKTGESFHNVSFKSKEQQPSLYQDRPLMLSGRKEERCILKVRVFLGKTSIVLFLKRSLECLNMLSRPQIHFRNCKKKICPPSLYPFIQEKHKNILQLVSQLNSRLDGTLVTRDQCPYMKRFQRPHTLCGPALSLQDKDCMRINQKNCFYQNPNLLVCWHWISQNYKKIHL